jgi:hypothetical protein
VGAVLAQVPLSGHPRRAERWGGGLDGGHDDVENGQLLGPGQPGDAAARSVPGCPPCRNAPRRAPLPCSAILAETPLTLAQAPLASRVRGKARFELRTALGEAVTARCALDPSYTLSLPPTPSPPGSSASPHIPVPFSRWQIVLRVQARVVLPDFSAFSSSSWASKVGLPQFACLFSVFSFGLLLLALDLQGWT